MIVCLRWGRGTSLLAHLCSCIEVDASLADGAAGVVSRSRGERCGCVNLLTGTKSGPHLPLDRISTRDMAHHLQPFSAVWEQSRCSHWGTPWARDEPLSSCCTGLSVGFCAQPIPMTESMELRHPYSRRSKAIRPDHCTLLHPSASGYYSSIRPFVASWSDSLALGKTQCAKHRQWCKGRAASSARWCGVKSGVDSGWGKDITQVNAQEAK
jgi:hypothetical protein